MGVKRFLLSAFQGVLWLSGSPANAATADATDPLAAQLVPPCSVVAQDKGTAAKTIYAFCGQKGVWLGVATGFRSSYNPVLKALLVVTTWQDKQRVRAVYPLADANLQVDDFTRDLTRLSGRIAELGLTADVDISTFALDGSVSIQQSAMVSSVRDSGSAAASEALVQPAASAQRRLDLRPFLVERN